MSDRLPIYELEEGLIRSWNAAKSDRRFVLEAPTGSGKSTQVPQMLHRAEVLGDGEVYVLQPRRLAARMLARRVAIEMGSRLGDLVGYQVRFESALSRNTRIRYVTEGILLRRMLSDPNLEGVAAIVFDEFHERHLYGDITLAQALQLQESTRPDLALVVMSATLDTASLQDYLAPCQLLKSDGRTFPVTINYAPEKQRSAGDVFRHTARVCGEALHDEAAGNGDALVFMPGGHEIRKTISAIQNEKWSRDFDVLPLYGELPPQAQDAAVTRGRRRKIVVATNVAETSLTIDGVTVVIDSGLARMAAFDPNRGINTLTVQKISRASADQRAGRAGRTMPGVCYRLWAEKDHYHRAAREVPEVHRLDLAEVVLTLKACGAGDLNSFRWLEHPDEKALQRAVLLLGQLRAMDESSGEITALGRELSYLPVHPRHGRILLEAVHEDCLMPVAVCIALLQGRPLFLKGGRKGPADYRESGEFSDFGPLLRAWNAAARERFDQRLCSGLGVNANAAREAGKLADRLANSLAENPTDGQPLTAERLGRVLLSGFSDQVARRLSAATQSCAVVGGRRGTIPKDAAVGKASLFVATEITEVEGRELQVILNNVTAIDEAWLQQLFPDDYCEANEARWDASARRVVQTTATKFRDLVLREKQSGEPQREAAAEILGREVCKGNLKLKKWDHAVDHWIARVNCLSEWMPELEIPPFDDSDREFVIQQMCLGGIGYKDIKDRSPWPVLQKWLSAPQESALEAFVPERLKLSNGNSLRMRYEMGAEPVGSALLKHLYDETKTPTIANGGVKVIIEVLAPNHRPIQLTKDLENFWETSYPQIKKDLKGRYPKHEWR
ncbi:MAG: ATP-dependent helicase HrpB [Verrucomicrobiales bacterium]|jgi:ATP-dependent helicase HrpB